MKKNKFCYNRPVPEQYEFLIKVTITEGLKSRHDLGKLGGSWEDFYISIDNAKNEGTRLAISGNYNATKEMLAFLKTVGADRDQLWEEGAEYPKGEKEYYLRIVKSGIAYLGYISPDGTSWTEVGKHYFPGLSGNPCFGGLSNTGTEKTVKVDFAELRAIR